MKFIDLYDEMEKTAISAKLVDRAVGARLNKIDTIGNPVARALEKRRTVNQLNRMHQRNLATAEDVTSYGKDLHMEAKNPLERKKALDTLEQGHYHQQLAEGMHKTVKSVTNVNSIENKGIGWQTGHKDYPGEVTRYKNNLEAIKKEKKYLKDNGDFNTSSKEMIKRKSSENEALKKSIKASPEHVKKLKSDAASYAMEQEARAAAEKAKELAAKQEASKKLFRPPGYEPMSSKKLFRPPGYDPTAVKSKKLFKVPEGAATQTQKAITQDKPKGFLSRLLGR